MRIIDSELTGLTVPKLGFSDDGYIKSRIPIQYLINREFVVFRCCCGMGDWGLISAMPRLLKQKYPNSKVYLPSPGLLEKLFKGLRTTFLDNWACWKNPFENVKYIFKNNPYIDGYKDYINGIIYHDHYRIYNKNSEIPLIEQMLKYWRFEEYEYKDSQPELYFSSEEIEEGNNIINEYMKNDYGCLLISNKYDFEESSNQKIIKVLKQNPIKYFYYSSKPIEETSFNFINGIDFMELKIPIRIQFYIKSKAKLNIGNQCGINDIITRYSKVYTVPRSLYSNYVRGMIYL